MILWNKTKLLLLATTAACYLFISGCADDKKGGKHGGKRGHGSRAQLVEVYVAKLKSHRTTTVRSGTISARRIVKFYSQEEGRIVKLDVLESDQVNKGQLLVQLDDSLLKAQFNKANAKKIQAQQNLSRVRQLIRKQLIARDQLTKTITEYRVASADAELLKTRLENTKNIAPFAGVISQRLVEPGDVVAKHKHMLTLIDPNSFVIKIKLSETLISALKVNDKAEVIFDTLGHQKYQGFIKRIHPTVDSKTRQGTIEITLNKLPAGIKGGQSARVIMEAQSLPRLGVPFNAIRTDHQGEYLFIAKKSSVTKNGKTIEKTIAQRVDIRSGARDGGFVEILEGIDKGAMVISKGFSRLKSGKTVSIVNLSNIQQPGDKKKQAIVITSDK